LFTKKPFLIFNEKFTRSLKGSKTFLSKILSFIIIGFNLTKLGFQISSKTSKNYLVYEFLAQFISSTVTFVHTLLLGIILNGIVSGEDKNILIFYVLSYGLLDIFSEFSNTYLYTKSYFYRNFVDFNIFEIVLEKYKNIPVKYRNDKEFVEIERNLNVKGIMEFIDTFMDIFFTFYQVFLIFIAITFIDLNLLWIAITVAFFSFLFKLKNKIMFFETRDIKRYNKYLVDGSKENFKIDNISKLDNNYAINQNYSFLYEQYKNKVEGLRKYLVYYYKKVENLENISQYIMDASSAVIFVLIYLQGVNGLLEIGTLTVLVSNFKNLTGNLNMLVFYSTRLYSSFIEVKSADEFFKYEVKDKKYLPVLEKEKLELEFKDVSFTYPETDKEVLKNISFKITKGDILGILGENGSGKSTLIKLIHRVYTPTSGEILLNGQNILDIKDEEYFSILKCLSQEHTIENVLSVKEIIHLGNSSKDIDMDKIIRASKLSESEEFILQFDNQYDELISNRNLFLLNKYSDLKYKSVSPGQERRLNLAKIFYSESPFIILDEPTSNIDPSASNKIFNNFSKFSNNEILVIVSHDVLRLNTVANKILMLENGEIVEIGTKKDLYQNKQSKYFNILSSIKDSIN